MWPFGAKFTPNNEHQVSNPRIPFCVKSLQEHLVLLRRMAVALPAHFPELAALADAANEERDFFANVAHLQMHRRVRALARLSKVQNPSSVGFNDGFRHLKRLASPL